MLRDLFRKSGRPLERELELVPLAAIREHRFADGSTLRLPAGSRAAQRSAFEELAPGLGDRWTSYVDALGQDWELLRRDYLERPWDPGLADPGAVRRLASRQTLRSRLREALGEQRLQQVAAHPFTVDGHDPARVPAWLGTVSYVEQKFGAWTVPGGMAQVGEALARRLATRKVEVLTGTSAHDVVVRSGRAAALSTSAGELDADAVVCAVDPDPGSRPWPGTCAGPGAPLRRPWCTSSCAARCPRSTARWCCTGHPTSRCTRAGPPPTVGRPGRWRTGAGRPRTCWRRWRGAVSTSAHAWWSGWSAPRPS